MYRNDSFAVLLKVLIYLFPCINFNQMTYITCSNPLFNTNALNYLHSNEACSWADPVVGTEGPDPLKNYKNIGYLTITGPDP